MTNKKTDPLEELAKAYEACFSTPAGQAVLEDLDRVHLKQSPTHKTPTEYYQPHEVQIRAAEQGPVMRIHELIQLSDVIRRQKIEQAAKPPPPPEPEDNFFPEPFTSEETDA